MLPFYIFCVCLCCFIVIIGGDDDVKDGEDGNQFDMLWGSRRPGVYFGMKTSSAQPLLTGLMWWGATLGQPASVREQCSENDQLARYGWLEHDGRRYGVHEALDAKNNVNLTVSWVRVGPHHWASRVHAQPLDAGVAEKRRHAAYLTVAQYVASEAEVDGGPALLTVDHEAKWRRRGGLPLDPDQPAVVRGSHPDTGPFSVHFVVGDGASAPPLASRDASAASRQRLAKLAALKHAGLGSFWGVHKEADSAWTLQKDLMGRGAERMAKLTREVLRAVERDAHAEAGGAAAFKKLSERDQYAMLLQEDRWPPVVVPLPNQMQPNSNAVLVQHTLQMPFTVDVAFVNERAVAAEQCTAAADDGADPHNNHHDRCVQEQVKAQAKLLSGPALTGHLEAARRETRERVDGVWPRLASAPAAAQAAGRAAWANLIGGMGYWHGHSLELSPQSQAELQQWRERVAAGERDDQGRELREPNPRWIRGPDHHLLSAVPSRSFFPRGFLWDEGFHQLLIHDFDPALSTASWRSWFGAMREDGWIPREQILGSEAQARVPGEFLGQWPDHANPPTFCFLFGEIVAAANDGSGQCGGGGDDDESQQKTSNDDQQCETSASGASSNNREGFVFLSDLWPKLQTHYAWFASLQAGHRPFSVHWRGRKGNHTLASGLDDYPRGQQQASDDELHLDGLCWMILYARTMVQVGRFVGVPDSVLTRYTDDLRGYTDSLHSIHWSDELGRFADTVAGGQHSTVVGYVSLFPVLFGIVEPGSPGFQAVLTLMRDPSGMWSEHGLRSLSASDPWFGTDENYWRGPIWANFQYLACAALHRYYLPPAVVEDAPHVPQTRSVYDELRANVLRTLVSNYQETGYFWEQYHPATGKGQRSHPFTGWTATAMVRILSEKYH